MTPHNPPNRADVVAQALAEHRFDWNRLACCETVPLANRNDIAGWHRRHLAAEVVAALDAATTAAEELHSHIAQCEERR